VGRANAHAAPRFVDCTVKTVGAAAGKMRVTLHGNLGLVPDQPLRLAQRGLRVGDEVIIDAPADLRPGAPIVVAR
jgi:hypothetical protein